MKKTTEQAMLDKILYTGNEIPDGVASDKRSKFVLLGSPQELIDEVVNKSFHELVIWIAEYAYYKANPKTKRGVPSVVFEQVEKDFKKFLTPNKNRADFRST